MTDIWDEVLDAVSDSLPKFNKFLLKDYKEEQLLYAPEYIKTIYIEVLKRLEGEITFKGYRVLSPEERVKYVFDDNKYNTTVDITRSELYPVEYSFEYRKEIFKTYLYLPYMIDGAIIINNTKYYIIFSLLDSIFYHIPKDNGLGIKVLCGHLRFWRNLPYNFASTKGERFNDQLILTRIHMRSYKYTMDDIRTLVILYPLVQFGLCTMLDRYAIDRNDIVICTHENREDDDHIYFEIRRPVNGCSGLYLKVKNHILLDSNNASYVKVVSSLHYILQYFVKCKNTIYTDNDEIVDMIYNDDKNQIWKVILGKSIFGINYNNEIQSCGHSEQHMESLSNYLDDPIKAKLAQAEIYCDDIYDLIDYIFFNIEKYILTYQPNNLYLKTFNVLDLLLSDVVSSIFNRAYSKINNKKGGKAILNVKDVLHSLRINPKKIIGLQKNNQIVMCNPAVINDNALPVAKGRRCRATYSASNRLNSKNGAGKGAKKITANSDEHKLHTSWFVVESTPCINGNNADTSGTINPFVPISKSGKILRPDYADLVDEHTHMLVAK